MSEWVCVCVCERESEEGSVNLLICVLCLQPSKGWLQEDSAQWSMTARTARSRCTTCTSTWWVVGRCSGLLDRVQCKSPCAHSVTHLACILCVDTCVIVMHKWYPCASSLHCTILCTALCCYVSLPIVIDKAVLPTIKHIIYYINYDEFASFRTHWGSSRV